MKKVSLLILVSLILLLTFASCTLLDELLGKAPAECEHEWTEATCTAPKTCTKCNATEGEAAAHNWAAATCTAPKTCKTCNKTEGAPNGHTEVTLEAVAPTCTSTGLTEGKKCSVCNTVTKEQTVVAKLAHTEVDKPGTAATCTTAGLTAGKQCSVCQTWTVPQETIPAGNHALSTIPGTPATCTEAGLTEGKECLECHEIIVPQEPIPALGHNSDTVVPGKAATCTESGLTEGAKCSRCQTVTVEQETIPALGHDTEGATAMKENDHPATCTAPGSYDMVTRCWECGEIAHTEHFTIDQLDHKFVNYTHDEGSEKCGVDGTKTAYCEFECGTKSTVTDEGTALTHQMPTDTLCGEEWTCERGCGHKEVLEHDYAPATCQVLATCKKCGAPTGDFAAHIDGEPTTETVTPPTCTDVGIAYNVTKCTVCGVETKRERADDIPALGHNMLPATCDDPSTCANGCGKTEGEAIATHTPVPSFDGTALTYTCTTCNDTFTTDQVISYTGADKGDLFFTKNGDPSVSIVDGAYSIKAGEQKSQYMIYGPSNDKNHANTMTGWNATNESFGVFSFRVQPGTITETMRVIVMSSRNNPNWDANKLPGSPDAWSGNSLDILGIAPNGDGTFKITGYDITSNVLASVNGTDWVDIKMFIQINKDGVLTISYYINSAFVNTYTYDLLNPETTKTIKNLDINNFYMCGWTAPGTGFAIDDMYFGYQKNSEWLFDEHEHRWVDADCENAKHCSACGLVYEGSTALGHTEATRDVNVVAPDCVNGGSHDVETYCTVCQKVLNTEHVEDAALGHKPDENNVCTVCGVDLHECNLVAAEVIAPTCTEGGYTVYRCDHPGCTKFENRDFTDPAGHSMQAATCTAPKTCSVCGHTEGAALGHSYSAPSCAAAETCTVCGATKGQPNANAHQLTSTYEGGKLTYACSTCDYKFNVDTFDYSDGTNYNGMHANASQNNTVYTTNPDKANYPVMKDGYLEFIRTDAEAGAQKQLQMWLPSANGGTNKFSGFTAASNSIGYFAFKIDAKTDVNFEMKLVDHRVDTLPDGTGIRWGDQWAINDPVFRVMPTVDGKTELRGFNGISLGKFAVDANGFIGWVDVAIQIVLDPNTDKVIAHYYINGAYVATSSRDLTTHTDAIQGVYLNFNSKAAGCGYRIDNLTFGYSAHKHDLVPTVANGVLTYSCDCGTDFTISSELRDWDADGSDSALKNVPNGKVEISTENGQYAVMFNPTDTTVPTFTAGTTKNEQLNGWFEYEDVGAPGAQIQMWMPSNNRDADTLSEFSCENNSVGVISFRMKSSIVRHSVQDSSITFSIGKPRNAGDWSSSGGWDTSSINIFTIEDTVADGVQLKGGLNGTNLNLTKVSVADGWTEWFDVMMVIEMTDDGYLTIYYYINDTFCGSDSRDLNNPGGYRTLNPKKIEALQISGWTFAANTGIVFDDFYFGHTKNGHNTLDGQVHNITETTCGEKSTCSCGWTGYTVAHTFAFACAPACSVCGLANEHASTHANLVATAVSDGVAYVCSDCNYCYAVKSTNGHTLSDISDLSSRSEYDRTYDGTYFKLINLGTANAQHQFWIPGQTESPKFAGCSNANESTVFLSFSINAKDHHNTGIEFKVNANRGTSQWETSTGAGDGWSKSSVGVFKIKPTTEGATTVALGGYNGADLGSIAITGENGWTGWIDVVVVMHLNKDNTITVEYYVNGSLFATLHKDFVIWTYEINSLYVNGRTNEGQGFELKNFFFGYTNEGESKYKAPIYKSEIAADDVQSETLKTIVASKIKQCDQTSAPNVEGGTPVYVLANGKDGAEVEALYISRTYPWTTETVHFTEFRFAINGEKEGPAVTKISFDYKIDGTVETNDRFTFTDFDGTKFSADAYVQVKTLNSNADVIEQAGDNYPELKGSDLVLDGEWHTFTYEFATPRYLIDFLLNLYHFQGELLIANVEVEFERESNLYNEDGSLNVTEIGNRNSTTDNTANVTNAALLTIVDGKIKQFDQTNKAAEGDTTYGYFVKEVGTSHYVTLEGKDGEQVEAVYLSRSVDWDTYASVSTQNGFKSEFRFAIDNTKRVTSISFDYVLNGTLTGNRSTGNANGQLSIFQIKYTNKADNTYNPNDQYFDVITDRVDGENNFIVTDGEWHTFSYTFENSVQLDNFLIILSEFQGELVISNLEVEYESNLYNEDGSLNVTEIGTRKGTEGDVSQVTDAALLTIVDNKLKQLDQTDAASEGDHSYGYFVKEGGTSRYVTLEGKDGETVQGVYVSRSVDWDTYAEGTVNGQNYFKSEFRFSLDKTKTIKSISFDYVINGSVTPNRRETDQKDDLAIFQVRDTSGAYTDIFTDKGGASESDADNDDVYVMDGQWHTFTYEWKEGDPTNLDLFLIILSEFQGEMVMSNIVVEYQ